MQLGAVPLPKSADPGASSRERRCVRLHARLTAELAAITALGQPARRLWGGDPDTNEEM